MMDPTCHLNGYYSNASGMCVCDYFYDSSTNCSLSFFEVSDPGTMITYYSLALLFLVLLAGIYIPEMIFDCRYFGKRSFKTTASLTKMAMLLYLTLTLIRVAIFIVGYHLNIAMYGSYTFAIHDFDITVMLIASQMAMIEWFGMLMKAENLGHTPRHVKALRITLICILVVGLVIINLAFIVEHLGYAVDITGTIVGFGSLFFFSISLLICGVYIIKTLVALNRRMKENKDAKSGLKRRTIFLLIMGCVIILNYVLLAFTPVKPGSTDQYIQSIYVSMLFEYVIAFLIWGFAQNHTWKNGKLKIIDAITQTSKGNSSAKSSSKSSGHSTSSTEPPTADEMEAPVPPKDVI